MYTWEMEKFINQRDKRIGGDDLLKIISQEENPQIKVVRYIAGEGNNYGSDHIVAKNDSGEGTKEFQFDVMPHEEAKAKGLVKKK